MRFPACLVVLVLCFSATSVAQPAPVVGATNVPPVIRFSGGVSVAPGEIPMTFGLYRDEVGGEPLWVEHLQVRVDPDGGYSVALGATVPLPVERFLSGEVRWLDVAIAGQPPQPRRLLVSVPYALKAADAETIGGKPLSAFVLAGEKTGVGDDGLTYVDRRVLASGLASAANPGPAAATGAAPGGAGTANFIGMFGDPTTLVNSVIYQGGGNIGVNTTTPSAAFHLAAVTTTGPAMYVDSFATGVLGTLPMLYRSARGTPVAPSAVQANDILGGLAVRGYGATTWSSGRGQVMYRAAENWTDTAQGTYLQLTTTPVGGSTWVERMRVAPEGYVGFGNSAPEFPVDVRLARSATYAKFGTAAGFGSMFIIANNPHLGFNVYYDLGYKYGANGTGGYMAFSQDLAGGFSWATAPGGSKDALATMTTRMVLTSSGRLGIGTLSPTQALDVVGGINTSGGIVSGGAVTATSISAGPGLTGTPFAYASYGSTGTKYGGTPNITCTWDGTQGSTTNRWLCTLYDGSTPINYDADSYAVIVTPSLGTVPRIPATNMASLGGPTLLVIRLFLLDGTSQQASFSVVVYKL
jgi:hypothetical protein